MAATRDISLVSATDISAFMTSLPYHLLHPVGDNTSCVEVRSGNDLLILDAGSGLRRLGNELSRSGTISDSDFDLLLDDRLLRSDSLPEGQTFNILFSHTHWDHIQGFPFFAPAYEQGNVINIYGHDSRVISAALNLQQKAPDLFPISLDEMGAELRFHSLTRPKMKIGSFTISTFPTPHPGGSLAFRIESEKDSLIYATDYEYSDLDSEEARKFIEFIAGADVFISDTQYTYLESVAREGWGHSTSFSAMDLAIKAGVRSFFLFHHDPEHDDAKLFDNLEKTRAYHLMMSEKGTMRIELASEGLTLDI